MCRCVGLGKLAKRGFKMLALWRVGWWSGECPGELEGGVRTGRAGDKKVGMAAGGRGNCGKNGDFGELVPLAVAVFFFTFVLLPLPSRRRGLQSLWYGQRIAKVGDCENRRKTHVANCRVQKNCDVSGGQCASLGAFLVRPFYTVDAWPTACSGPDTDFRACSVRLWTSCAQIPYRDFSSVLRTMSSCNNCSLSVCARHLAIKTIPHLSNVEGQSHP